MMIVSIGRFGISLIVGNWGNIAHSVGGEAVYNSNVTLNTSGTLRASWNPAASPTVSLWYKINDGSAVSITNDTTDIVLTAGQTLKFGATRSGPDSTGETITIKQGSTTIDTFTVSSS